MANFKVNDVPSWIQYVATNGQTQFSIPFPFIDNSDLSVWQNGLLLTLTTDYTLSGAQTASGGQLTLNTGANLNDQIVIQDLMEIDRTNIYLPTISALTGSALNNDFNRDVIMIRDTTTTVNYLMLQYEPYANISQDLTNTTDRIIPILGPMEVWQKDPTNSFIQAIALPAIPIGVDGNFTQTNRIVTTNLIPGPNYVQQTDLQITGDTITALSSNLTLTGTNNVNISPPGDINLLPGGVLNLDGAQWPTTGAAPFFVPRFKSGSSTIMEFAAGATVTLPVQDMHVAVFDGTAGSVMNSLGVIDGSGNLTGLNTVVIGGTTLSDGSLATNTGDLTLDAGSGNLLGTVDPTEPLGLATKQYVDAIEPTYPISAAHGGTGIASPTIHNLLIAQGSSAFNLLALGSNQILIGNTGSDPSGLTLGTGVETALGQSVTGSGGIVLATSPTLVTPALGTPSSGTLTNCTGLLVAGGGTGDSNFTAYAVICGGTTSTGALQAIASVGSSGNVLTSNGAGALPTFQALPAAGIPYTGTASTTIAAAVNNGYITTASTLATVTLPATAPVGSIVAVQGQGTGGWTLAANTGQTIKFINTTTTSGGSYSSTSQFDTILVISIVADTMWSVQSAASLGLTTA